MPANAGEYLKIHRSALQAYNSTEWMDALRGVEAAEQLCAGGLLLDARKAEYSMSRTTGARLMKVRTKMENRGLF